MLSNFFNHASMHPVKTALYGGALILATPFIMPYLAPVLLPSLMGPVASLAHIFGITAMVAGGANMAVHASNNIGPMFNSASHNGGKIALSGIGVGVAAPYVAPLLGSLGAPALALAGIFAPAAIAIGAVLLATRLASPLFKAPPAAPRLQHA